MAPVLVLRDRDSALRLDEPKLRSLILQRIDALVEDCPDYALEQLVRFVIVEPGDRPEALAEQLGFRPLQNRWNGAPFGRWYPAVFVDLNPERIKPVCILLQGGDPVSMFLFWERRHGSLGGRTVPEALRQGDVQAAARVAEGFAREQLVHAAAA